MRIRQKQSSNDQTAEASKKTPTFLLEVPLRVTPGQAKRLRAHLEAARQLYNAVLSEGQRRLWHMRADPAWQTARAIPRTQKLERQRAFAALRQQYGFSEYALHDAAKGLNCAWIADHVDAVLAQTLATRAYRALNRVCLGQARRVRFKSRGRGLSSVENKRPNTGLRFVLQPPEEGNAGYLLWQGDRLPALIDWEDPVVTYGLAPPHQICPAGLRQASSARAGGADERASATSCNWRWRASRITSPNTPSAATRLGWIWGPPRLPSCHEKAPHGWSCSAPNWLLMPRRSAVSSARWTGSVAPTTRTTTMRKGRIKQHGKRRSAWKHSKRYLATRRRKATRERRLAAHRKSLHGRLVHEIVAVGNTIITEKISYRAWQKQFGRSVGLRAPGMFIELLRRTVARTGGTLVEVPTRSTKLSQFCHGCGKSCPEAVVAALASVSLWRLSAARPLLGVSGRLSGSSRSSSLVCPAAVRRRLGRSGARPAGSIRASIQRASAGQHAASQLWYPRSRSASARKSTPSHTRARLLSRATGNVEARQGTSSALARRGLRMRCPCSRSAISRSMVHHRARPALPPACAGRQEPARASPAQTHRADCE